MRTQAGQPVKPVGTPVALDGDMTITRTAEGYSVVTDTRLTDGTLRADDRMVLVGNELRSVDGVPGHIRTGGLLRIKLGPRSIRVIEEMPVGHTVDFVANVPARKLVNFIKGTK